MEKKLAVCLEQISKSFKTKPALTGIDLSLEEGSRTALAGPDGAGKTTLIRIIAALFLPNCGKATVLGCDTAKQGQAIQEQLGYMPQQFSLYEDLTVRENLVFYANVHSLPEKQTTESLEALLSTTRLHPFVDRRAKALSGGMKQKLSLACALVRIPKLLLLDEPTAGIDPLSRKEIWTWLRHLQYPDLTMLWSTSHLPETREANQTVFLQEGKIASHLEHLPKEPYHSPLLEVVKQEKSSCNFAIEARSLTKTFNGFTAVDQLSFQVHPGEIFGLLGPNGAGKSTTFKMLCGLLQPTQGQAFVNGISLQSSPKAARCQIGYMAQKFSLYRQLTVLQNLLFFSGIYQLQNKNQETTVKNMVEVFHLQSWLHATAEELPIGYRQRLALACAIMHQPKVLFLDEPTSGADPSVRREFWGHIRALSQAGCAILVSTHYLEEAEFCHRIGLIHQSHLIYEGTPEQLKQKAGVADLEEAFIQFIQGHQP